MRRDQFGDKIDNLSYTYQNNNRLQSTTDPDAETINYSYDSNGNLISTTEDGAPKFRTIQYDSRNLPVFVELGDFTDIIYLYNADAQRIFKKVDDEEGEHYIMDGSVNVGVFTESGSLKHWNILANGTVGRVTANGDKHYYITDNLGSTRAVVDENGVVVESHDYYPFGLLMPFRAVCGYPP